MNFNWQVRFRNKTWLTTFLAAVVAFVYNMLAMFDVVPNIGQEQVQQGILLVLSFLAGFGVIVDPTTNGASDSPRAMSYRAPMTTDPHIAQEVINND